MCLFHYNPRDRAGFYIDWAVTCEHRLLSKTSEVFDVRKDTGKRPVGIGKDVCQDTKRSTRKHTLQANVIFIDESGSQQNPYEAFFQNKVFVEVKAVEEGWEGR